MQGSTLSAASKPWSQPRTPSSALDALPSSLLSALPDIGASPTSTASAPGSGSYSYAQATQSSSLPPPLHLPAAAASSPTSTLPSQSSASATRSWYPAAAAPSPTPPLPTTTSPQAYEGLYAPHFLQGPLYSAYLQSSFAGASYPPSPAFGYSAQLQCSAAASAGPLFGHPQFPPPPPIGRRQSSGAGWRGRGGGRSDAGHHEVHAARLGPSHVSDEHRALQPDAAGHMEGQARLDGQVEAASHPGSRGIAAVAPSAMQGSVGAGAYAQSRPHAGRALHVDTAPYERREKKVRRLLPASAGWGRPPRASLLSADSAFLPSVLCSPTAWPCSLCPSPACCRWS